MTRGPCIALALAIQSVPASALAYRTAADLPEIDDEARVRWTSDVTVALHDGATAGLGLVEAEAATQAGFESWAALDCGGVELRPIELTRSPAAPGDGIATVQIVERGWSARGLDASAAATTDVTYERTGGVWRITDADVYINAVDYTWTAAPADGGEQRDIVAVLTHEAGHVIGLLHPCELDGSGPSCAPEMREATMHPEYLGVSQRTLGADDEAGACFLYAPGPCEGEGCRAGPYGAPCATGDDCASGACLHGDGLAAMCTERCGEGAAACAAGHACDSVSGADVCVPEAPASGCAVGRSSNAGALPVAVGLWVLLAIGWRARRRR